MFPSLVFSIRRVMSEQSVLKYSKAINLLPSAVRMLSHVMQMFSYSMLLYLYLQKQIKK